ncbi:MAG: zinc/manganese transporter permease [Sideroxydans sp.]|nr:zinc/manganese transporter permease [Sideroxydans sp.]
MNSLELDILLPAFIAGLLILATHIPFGMRVLQRGVIFADLAVAQIAGLGVIIAALLELDHSPVLVQLIAASSALFGAGLLAWIERSAPDVKEAYIGLTFVLSASLGILLMSHDVHAGEHLKDLLVGQILWVNDAQLIGTAILSAALLIAWRSLRNSQSHFAFYGLFALAVTASVQLVGIYLVFASLIVPALATYRLQTQRITYAATIGISGYGLGLLLSVWFDLPAGVTIVCAMAVIGLVTAVLKRPS